MIDEALRSSHTAHLYESESYTMKGDAKVIEHLNKILGTSS